MEVFQISPKPKISVLVVGRSGDQFTMCSLLHANNIDFQFTSHIIVAADYYAHMDGFDGFDDLDGFDEFAAGFEFGGEKPSTPRDINQLFAYSKDWIFSSKKLDHALSEQKYDVVIDTCADTEEDRITGLRALFEQNPNALFLTTQYSCTATELGSITGITNSIVGYALVGGSDSLSLIDIAPSLGTSAVSVKLAQDFFKKCGVETEVVEDRVGLVQMRTLAMLINEAAFALMEGVATAEEIDKAMQMGVNYPKGLLAWADEIGLDVVLLVLESLNKEYGQERYRPCVLIKQYVRAGWVGKRLKRGFYNYA
ncbi:MAG: hypothetical protein HQ472_10085 [Ignavibacteria bacterium]|nr:hypothetical protein [Ignavibacteria bacterium]